MSPRSEFNRRTWTRAQVGLAFIVLTAAIACGLSPRPVR